MKAALYFLPGVIALVGIRAPAQQANTIPSGYIRMATAIGDDYFDGRDTRTRVQRHLRIANELGVHYLRCAFSWNGIEPERGRYDFRFWDMLVDESAKAGIELIPYVAYTPEWAAREKKNFWQQPPADPKTFAAFMERLATRYRGRIHSWELWNEPDNRDYWQGSADEFAAMVIPAAQAIRRADPSAKLVLGGMSYGAGEFFQQLMSRNRIAQDFDLVAMHAYPETWHESRAEEVFQEELPRMHDVANSTANHPSFWLNEMGYADYRYDPSHASVYGTNTYYTYEHTARYAADFLMKSFLMTAASGDVSLAGWYRIDDFAETDPRMSADKVNDHLGIERSNHARKPAFYAFRLFNHLLSKPFRVVDSTASVTASRGSQAVVHTFLRDDGRVVVAGWLRSSTYDEVPVHTGEVMDRRRENVNIALPCPAATVTNYDALGNHSTTEGKRTRELKNVGLTGDRVYLAVIRCEATN